MHSNLYQEFKDCQNLTIVYFKDTLNPTSRERICFVNFSNPEDARKAKNTQTGKIFCGFPMHVESVNPNLTDKLSNFDGFYDDRDFTVSTDYRKINGSWNRSVSPKSLKNDLMVVKVEAQKIVDEKEDSGSSENSQNSIKNNPVQKPEFSSTTEENSEKYSREDSYQQRKKRRHEDEQMRMVYYLN